MSLRAFFLFFLLSSFLFSLELQEHYKIDGSDFNASHIDPSIKNDFIIYHFEANKHQKSFTSSKLLNKFQKAGTTLIDDTKGIVHIKRNSELSYEPITKKIKSYYKSHYPGINIKSVKYTHNSYIDKLPQDYILHFKKKAYLYSRSSLQIISEKAGKRHFISYEIKASLKVFKAKNNINRGKLLTPLDLRSEIEVFTRFKAIPVQTVLQGRLRLKKRIVKDKVLYHNDIEKLPDVLKGKEVNVRYISGNVHLEFTAISLQDGYVSEEINIKKKDGQRLKAKVISSNLVEIK